mgnify:CR=1 FL=1
MINIAVIESHNNHYINDEIIGVGLTFLAIQSTDPLHCIPTWCLQSIKLNSNADMNQIS